MHITVLLAYTDHNTVSVLQVAQQSSNEIRMFSKLSHKPEI